MAVKLASLGQVTRLNDRREALRRFRALVIGGGQFQIAIDRSHQIEQAVYAEANAERLRAFLDGEITAVENEMANLGVVIL